MSSDYLLATLERAIRTAAQAALALIGTDAVGITDVDWAGVASAAGLAAVISLLTSVAGIKFAPGDGPAMFGPEKVEHAPEVEPADPDDELEGPVEDTAPEPPADPPTGPPEDTEPR